MMVGRVRNRPQCLDWVSLWGYSGWYHLYAWLWRMHQGWRAKYMQFRAKPIRIWKEVLTLSHAFLSFLSIRHLYPFLVENIQSLGDLHHLRLRNSPVRCLRIEGYNLDLFAGKGVLSLRRAEGRREAGASRSERSSKGFLPWHWRWRYEMKS